MSQVSRQVAMITQQKNVGIKMPYELRQKAQEYGINISALARKAVENEIRKIEGEVS